MYLVCYLDSLEQTLVFFTVVSVYMTLSSTFWHSRQCADVPLRNYSVTHSAETISGRCVLSSRCSADAPVYDESNFCDVDYRT